MRLYNFKVRYRKRSRIWTSGFPLKFLVLFQFLILIVGANGFGSDWSGNSLTVNFVSKTLATSNLAVNLGSFLIIYSGVPYFSSAKSIRGGKEIEESPQLVNVSTTESTLVQNQSTTLPPQPNNTTDFSSRTLQVSEEESSTRSPSQEREANLDSDTEENEEDEDDDLIPYEDVDDSAAAANIKEFRKTKKKQRQRERNEKGANRLKRQMGMAAEVAMIAPTLQTMGCIPKFFCGLNSKPPTDGTSTLNDFAYLIKFAMLDDDDADEDDPLFEELSKNNRGKDGLSRIKEDLILENMAEDELIQEDPANLPFVMKDMDHRIKVKTKPGTKLRLDDDILDAIIVEPEQTAMGSLLTGIKSVFRIGRSNEPDFNQTSSSHNSSSSPRKRRNAPVETERSLTGRGLFSSRGQRWRRRFKKPPFWATPQFKQEMELAQRIGKAEQDDAKCSTTFKVCPYTVNEMMDIVHGGYQKRQKKQRKKQPQWYINNQGPPESSEEDSKEKPFKDPENLVTTTTEKTKWYPNDPENQVYYAMFPHKAVEKGITPVPVTKIPSNAVHITTTEEPESELIDPILGFRQGLNNKRRRRPQNKIQSHIEYENDDEGSLETKKAEQLDLLINSQKNSYQSKRPSLSSWWSGSKKQPQRMPQHRPQGHNGGRPPPGQNSNNQRPIFNPERDAQEGEDQSSEEVDKRRHKKKNKNRKDGSESTEDEEGSSEENVKKKATPAPTLPSVQTTTQPIIIGLGGFAALQDPENNQQHQIIIQPLQDMDVNQHTIFHIQSKTPPISAPRPKYKIQKERPVKKKKRPSKKEQSIRPVVYQPVSQVVSVAPSKPNQEKKDDRSNEETSDEEEDQDEESQENSSEEKPNNNVSQRPNPPPPPPPPLRRPPLRGRPSEEIREPVPSQHRHEPLMRPQHGGENSDEEGRNSNSAPVEGFSNEMMPHMIKMNTSSEYTYIEDTRRPPSMMRPINYSYFKNGNNNNQGPVGPPPQQQGPPPPPSPPSTTEKYSTGFLSFLFGKKDKRNRGSFEKQHQQQNRPHNPQMSPNGPSREYDNDNDDDVMEDEDGDEDSNEQGNENNNAPVKTITGPSGKFEVGHLRPPPKAIKPNFKPPQRPQRPYRGATSMEDSDEKKARPTSSPAQSTPESLRPLLFIGKPHRIIIPHPATPPPRTTQAPLLPYTTSKPESEEQNDGDSDEESKEDDESKENSSEEKPNKSKNSAPSKTATSTLAPQKSEIIPLPPIANFGNILPENVLAVSGPYIIPEPARSPPSTTTTTTRRPPPPPKATKTKNRTDYRNSEEAQAQDDSNQTKEDDSDEETKFSKEDRSDENSDEEKNSSEENKEPMKKRRPPPRRPEDDELEHPAAQYPPLPPVGGDIAAVEEILGVPQDGENTDDEAAEGYLADNVPAAPPLALQGFPSGLEIVVPTKAPPIRIPPLNPNPNGATSNNFGSAPGVVANQAGGTGNGQPGGGSRQPSEQIQQGLRNPGSSGNRGPGNRNQGNRRPGQQNQNQQGNKKEDGDGSEEKNSSEENKTEEEGDSSEENTNQNPFSATAFDGFPTNEFDQAILSLGVTDDDDEDGGGGQFADAAGKQPPVPPIFTGSAQKQELQKNPSFLQRPVTPATPIFYRPKPGRPRPGGGLNRNDPILKHQLQQSHLNQNHQHQQILPFRPSAAAGLKPMKRPSHPSQQSFLVSHLLRPMMQKRPQQQPQKPLDPKVVQWIRETYGIPDINQSLSRPTNNVHSQLSMALQGPHRAGLTSEALSSPSSSAAFFDKNSNQKAKKTKPKKKTKGSSEKTEPASKEKHSSKRKATTKRTTTTTPIPATDFFEEIIETENQPTSSLSPLFLSAHIFPKQSKKPTLSTTTMASTTTKKTRKTTPITTTPSTTTTRTTTTTTSKPKPSSTSSDYITEELESIMAQALFSSEEEEESEEDSEDDIKPKKKSEMSANVGNKKLLITVKSVKKNTPKSESSKQSSSSSSSEEKLELIKTSLSKIKPSSSVDALRKKLNIKSLTSAEKSSERKKVSSKEKSHSLSHRKGSSNSNKKSSKTPSKARPTASTTLSAKNTVTVNSRRVSTPRPRPKPIKLPPIYGKITRRI